MEELDAISSLSTQALRITYLKPYQSPASTGNLLRFGLPEVNADSHAEVLKMLRDKECVGLARLDANHVLWISAGDNGTMTAEYRRNTDPFAKPNLVLDLDQTLVCSPSDFQAQNHFGVIVNGIDMVHVQYTAINPETRVPTPATEMLYISPMIMEFLRNVAPFFDVKVATMSPFERASGVVDTLDPQREHLCRLISPRPRQVQTTAWAAELFKLKGQQHDGSVINPAIISRDVMPRLTQAELNPMPMSDRELFNQAGGAYKVLKPPERTLENGQRVTDTYFLDRRSGTRTVIIDDGPMWWPKDRANVVQIEPFRLLEPGTTNLSNSHAIEQLPTLRDRVHNRLATLWTSPFK